MEVLYKVQEEEEEEEEVHEEMGGDEQAGARCGCRFLFICIEFQT